MLSLDNADPYKGLVFSSLKQPQNRDFCMCYINPDGRLRSLRQQMQASLVKMAGNFCFNKTIFQKKHLAALADFCCFFPTF